MKQKKYYVYTHEYASGPMAGRVFYVGKGKGKRAYAKKGRNNYWIKIESKYGRKVNIVFMFNNELCAFSFERSLIKFYGRESLVNMTDGGEGSSGWVPDQNARDRFSEMHKGKIVSIESRMKMSMGQTGRVHSDETRLKMSISKSGRNHPRFDHKLYNFIGNEGIEINIVRYDMAEKYGLSHSALSLLCMSKIKSHRGWKLLDNP